MFKYYNFLINGIAYVVQGQSAIVFVSEGLRKTFCISFKTTRQISPADNPLFTYKKMSVFSLRGQCQCKRSYFKKSLKNQISEAKRTGSIVILYFKKRKKRTFVFFKRKGLIVNYRRFAISTTDVPIPFFIQILHGVKMFTCNEFVLILKYTVQ